MRSERTQYLHVVFAVGICGWFECFVHVRLAFYIGAAPLSLGPWEVSSGARFCANNLGAEKLAVFLLTFLPPARLYKLKKSSSAAVDDSDPLGVSTETVKRCALRSPFFSDN